MIVVIVTQQHKIDGGKIVPTNSLGPAAARCPARGTRDLTRPDHTGSVENITSLMLQQDRGMIDKRDARL